MAWLRTRSTAVRATFWAGWLLTALALAPLALADPFAEGLAAYDAGDYPETVRIWTELAQQGDPFAQVGLAGLYRSGQGVERDLGIAADFYRQAAEQGNDDAQLNLGRLYAEGGGVRRDLVTAYAWLSLAAAQGRGWAERRREALRADMSPAQLAAAERQIEALQAER